MSDVDDVVDLDDPEWLEFERIGRAAGAALRTPAPDDLMAGVERAVRRRTARRAVVGGAVILVGLLAVGWAAARWDDDRGGAPMNGRIVGVRDGRPLPSGAPGTWRPLSGGSAMPDLATSATWTGTEAIVLGLEQALSPPAPWKGAAYDVREGRWRAIADPPSDLVGVLPAWTGDELLAAGSGGRVYSYDPATDRWRQRSTAASSSSAWSSTAAPVAVTATGVLTRSSDEWWWYDEARDAWRTVPAPAEQLDGLTARTWPNPSVWWLNPLDATRVLLSARVDGDTVYSVFDAEQGGWSPERTAPVPTQGNGNQRCGVFDGRLLCFGESIVGNAGGVVTDIATGESSTFSLTLGNHSSQILTDGTPWFGHAWGLLLARTAGWEPLPDMGPVHGFGAAAWDGEELLMFGTVTETGGKPSVSAVAYTPLERP